jgi:hypothetical protein
MIPIKGAAASLDMSLETPGVYVRMGLTKKEHLSFS